MSQITSALPYHNGSAEMDKKGFSAPQTKSITRNSSNTPSFPTKMDPGKYHKRRKLVLWGIRYFLIVAIVSTGLVVPIIVTNNVWNYDFDDEPNLIQTYQRQIVIWNLFLWLVITWGGGVTFDVLIMAFPYMFRFISHYLNSAHHRYWRVFRVLRLPITLIGTVICSYIGFALTIMSNAYINGTTDGSGWDGDLENVLMFCTFWTVFFLVEKCLILYISIHYHYRRERGRITHSKEMHTALATLYEASVSAYGVHNSLFAIEDQIIHSPDSKVSMTPSRAAKASKFLSRVGFGSNKKRSFFGDIHYEKKRTHWADFGSPYVVVERALGDSKSAAALATRIWKSFVAEGEDKLKADDIAEALGPFRKEEAQSLFQTIDENESKDLTLEELIFTVVEVGRVRKAIYQGMETMDHCLNTFDWILQLMLGIVMVALILITYVPVIKSIQQTVSFVFIGLSFVVGRILHKFFSGCILVFFEHPFDIGDRVQVYNVASTSFVNCYVVHQSILYTVFRRNDNQLQLQITNERLSGKRIENITRSGVNKESRSMNIDFKTSFVDLMYLRTEMEEFLKANSRDYLPALGLSVTEIHELRSMEIKVSWTHKSNWDNEALRAKRSMRFMCALTAAIKKVPIGKPGGLPLGDEGRPLWQIQVNEAEGRDVINNIKKQGSAGRIDAGQPKQEDLDEDARKRREKEEKVKRDEDEAKEKLTKVPVVKKVNLSTGFEVENCQGVVGVRSRGGGEHGITRMYYP